LAAVVVVPPPVPVPPVELQAPFAIVNPVAQVAQTFVVPQEVYVKQFVIAVPVLHPLQTLAVVPVLQVE